MDEDEMFQDAAQSLLGGGTGEGNEGSGEGDNKGGMPDGGAADQNTLNTNTDAPDANKPTPEGGTTQQEPAKTPAPPAAPPAPEPINFEGISKGLIKTPEDITRMSSEYLEMRTELASLREKVAVDPFVNEFVKTLDQMHRDGKSLDQVKAFIQLQELGEISKLPPVEAMIQAKVLRDGHNAEIARKMIERKYKITEGMDPDEKEVIEAEMKDDAKADYAYLTSQKKELATPKVPVPEAAVNTISREAIMNQVAPVKERVKEQFKTLGQINLNAKFETDGKPAADAVLFDLPIPADFREKIPAIFEDFFVNSGVEVNEDNVKTALGLINYELFNQSGVKIIQDACIHYGEQVEKRVRDEYELKGTPTKRHTVNQPVNDLQLTDEALQEYVNGG